MLQVRLVRVRVGSRVPTPDSHGGAERSPNEEAEAADEGCEFSFEGGQWVDFHIPGIEQIGGYTIISGAALPAELALRQLCPTSPLEFDLAVKMSRHPPVSASPRPLSARVRATHPN